MPGGRPGMGPELVEGLEGSREAKQKMKVFLETLVGSRTIEEASEVLGINASLVHKHRRRAIQAGVEDLEAKPIGRPRRESGRIAALEEELAEVKRQKEALERQVKALEVKDQLFSAVPGLRERGIERAKKGKHQGPIR